ncbi:MAG: hypothetical protein VKN72_18825 [Nostocales cyanobacterium 94392]|nr:hypothetical protein [Nostocales cyanobacterium 94392]
MIEIASDGEEAWGLIGSSVLSLLNLLKNNLETFAGISLQPLLISKHLFKLRFRS